MSAREAALAAMEAADDETRERLLEADAVVAAARADLKAAEAARAEQVVRAAEEGWTNLRIGTVLGLTHQRIAQIRRGE